MDTVTNSYAIFGGMHLNPQNMYLPDGQAGQQTVRQNIDKGNRSLGDKGSGTQRMAFLLREESF
jgi:hypothetical protein